MTRLGDYFGTYLDDKPAGAKRVTTFIIQGQEPDQSIPADQGRRQLSAAEGRYEELTEQDAS